MGKHKFRHIVIVAILMFLNLSMSSQENRLVRQTISNNGGSSIIDINGNTSIVHQSIGQSAINGTVQVNKSTIRQGFIQPYSNRSLVENPSSFNVNVYPNPFLHEINIQSNDWDVEVLTIRLYDLTGRMVKLEEVWAQENISYNWSGIETGQYILQISWIDDRSIERVNTSTILKL